MTAIVFLPTLLPIVTMASAKLCASSSSFINAPAPVFTSKTIASAPEANFLLIIELAIKGIALTVAVTSRKLYIFLSAGVKLPDRSEERRVGVEYRYRWRPLLY